MNILKVLLFLFLSSFAMGEVCYYKVINPEILVWSYPVSVNGFLDTYLDKERYLNVPENEDFQIEVRHEQVQGRYLKRAYIFIDLIVRDKIETIQSSKACFYMNCSVYDFTKVLKNAIFKLNKSTFCDDNLII